MRLAVLISKAEFHVDLHFKMFPAGTLLAISEAGDVEVVSKGELIPFSRKFTPEGLNTFLGNEAMAGSAALLDSEQLREIFGQDRQELEILNANLTKERDEAIQELSLGKKAARIKLTTTGEMNGQLIRQVNKLTAELELAKKALGEPKVVVPMPSIVSEVMSNVPG